MAHWVYFSDSGAPKTGLSPVFDTWRYADGSAPASTPTITELSAANAPGWYSFEFEPQQRLLVTVDSADGAMAAGERYVPLVLDPYDDAGRRAVQLAGENTVVVWSSFDSEGRPTAGARYTFDSKADAEAAYASASYGSAVETYTIAQSYDSQGRPTRHSEVREP